jgi:pimeloyl-ACP methyl ester carboxylesterase
VVVDEAADVPGRLAADAVVLLGSPGMEHDAASLEVPEVYDAADPATRLRERPSCEVVVIHGDRDQAVPVESSRGLKGRFDWLDYRELPGVDHFAVIDPLSEAWPVVLDAIGASSSHQGRRSGETLEA